MLNILIMTFSNDVVSMLWYDRVRSDRLKPAPRAGYRGFFDSTYRTPVSHFLDTSVAVSANPPSHFDYYLYNLL